MNDSKWQKLMFKGIVITLFLTTPALAQTQREKQTKFFKQSPLIPSLPPRQPPLITPEFSPFRA